jgi:septal ring factor EnvC (AmiA/AmiB activator)
VNGLGLNANFVFVENGPAKEKLIREGVVTNNNNISGNNNKVSNITPVFQGHVTGNISIAEKIVQGMPPKERKEMKQYMNNVEKEILDLKKTIDYYKKQLRDKEKELKEKDKRLMDTQEQLIKVVMGQNKKTK